MRPSTAVPAGTQSVLLFSYVRKLTVDKFMQELPAAEMQGSELPAPSTKRQSVSMKLLHRSGHLF
jgi:hypothetical protein